MSNRNYKEFEIDGVKYSIVHSNNFNWKFQAAVLTERGWELTRYYANSPAELRREIREGITKESYM